MITFAHLDRWLAVAHKPPGAIVHRTRGAAGAPILLDLVRARLGGEVWPLHRLDRQTSGLIAFARDSETASLAGREIRAGLWHKSYVALCRGTLARSLLVDHPVREGGRRRPAVTEVHPLRAWGGRFSLVECVPRSGRRHQIRYHLKHAGHPLVGDANYGVGAINRFFRGELGLERFFLHARRLRLPHPARLQLLDLDAPLPGDLAGVLDRLAAWRGPLP